MECLSRKRPALGLQWKGGTRIHLSHPPRSSPTPHAKNRNFFSAHCSPLLLCSRLSLPFSFLFLLLGLSATSDSLLFVSRRRQGIDPLSLLHLLAYADSSTALVWSSTSRWSWRAWRSRKTAGTSLGFVKESLTMARRRSGSREQADTLAGSACVDMKVYGGKPLPLSSCVPSCPEKSPQIPLPAARDEEEEPKKR